MCGTLRSDSVTVTVAPGTPPPLTSVTTPRTAAVYDDCAQAIPETASAMQRKEMARKRFWMLLIAPPMRSGGRENCSEPSVLLETCNRQLYAADFARHRRELNDAHLWPPAQHSTHC